MYNIRRKCSILIFIFLLVITIFKNIGLSNEIEYVDVIPYVQEQQKFIKFYCIVQSSMDTTVFITILSPRYMSIMKPMIWDESGEYLNYSYFNITGKYTFFITVVEKNGIRFTSQPKYFWVTIDTNDIDNDGMPNWWETKFYLNPENPNDAREDYDNDGFNNLEEYQMGLNPWEKNFHIVNQVFLLIYLILFLSLISFIRYISRKIPWRNDFNIIMLIGGFIIILSVMLSYTNKSPADIILYIVFIFYIICYSIFSNVYRFLSSDK